MTFTFKKTQKKSMNLLKFNFRPKLLTDSKKWKFCGHTLCGKGGKKLDYILALCALYASAFFFRQLLCLCPLRLATGQMHKTKVDPTRQRRGRRRGRGQLPNGRKCPGGCMEEKGCARWNSVKWKKSARCACWFKQQQMHFDEVLAVDLPHTFTLDTHTQRERGRDTYTLSHARTLSPFLWA